MILVFDTSSAHVAAALLDGQNIRATAQEPMARGQAERLLPLIEALLSAHDLAWHDLTAIGVGTGPGNFTGVRLSVAAARGLALSLGIPAVGVSLLEAAALDMPGPVLACIEAPREQAYVQSFGLHREIPAQLVALDQLPAAWSLLGLTCTGSAGPAVAARLGAASAPPRHPPAEAIARIAALRWQDDPPRPAPLYLKPADAAPARDAPPHILDDA